jgi:hypothetical protein
MKDKLGDRRTCGRKQTDPKRALSHRIKRFLRAYTRCGYIRRASSMTGVSASLHYWWLNTSPRYRKVFQRAQRRAGHLRRDVLNRLAVEGQPKFHEGAQIFIYFDAKGVPVPQCEAVGGDGKLIKGFKRKPATDISVTALIFALKADFPDLRDNSIVTHQGTIKTNPLNEEIRKILADKESTELANSLARRMALNAGGNGQSAN